MKVTPELKRLLEEAAGEVAKWPKWKHSLDPIGDEGRENVQRKAADLRGVDGMKPTPPKALEQIADVVLSYRPKSKQPKPRKRKKAKRVRVRAV
jgi:hypothetical protein